MDLYAIEIRDADGVMLSRRYGERAQVTQLVPVGVQDTTLASVERPDMVALAETVTVAVNAVAAERATQGRKFPPPSDHIVWIDRARGTIRGRYWMVGQHGRYQWPWSTATAENIANRVGLTALIEDPQAY